MALTIDGDNSELPTAGTPVEVRAALIDSYYSPVFSFVVGSGSAILIAILAGERTHQPLFNICAFFLAAVSLARLAVIALYRLRDSRRNDDPRSIERWILAYAIGAYAFAACLGALGVIALLDTNDAVAHMLVYATNMGLMAGIATRNSGLRHIALGQIVLTLAPLGVAAAMRNDFDYDILAFTTFLYCLAGVEICLYQSTSMRRTLLATREKTALAQQLAEQNRRFDAALNNMPQGLAMFEADGRLVVANKRMVNIFDRSDIDLRSGQSVDEFCDHIAATGALTKETAKHVALRLRTNLSANQASTGRFQLPSGRMVSSTQAPLADGGAVVLFEDVTERSQAEARVRYLATHDVLTGLPNRTQFTQLLRDEIEESQRDGSEFGVLFIDLDRFKAINDTLGHAAGDALLREASRRLSRCLHISDICARLGGDEFVAVVRDIKAPQEAVAVAEAVLARFAAPMNIAGQECSVSASIGVAIYPVDGEDEDTLLKNADSAMYLAKAEGKSGVRVFSPKVKSQTLQGLMLETSMRHALDRNEFLVVYQPKRELATGALSGVEALLRWRHPEMGMLPPDRFIPIAEETGLIVPIGKWVLETACKQNMLWRAQGLPPITMAVNLSPRQLYDDRLLSDISEALEHSGMEPELLELEITESMVMEDAGDAIMVLRAVKDMGVRLAIDDFGTGYSSLSLVKRLPLDTIKIDRSFINDLLTDANDRAIAEAVISLGQALKLRVVAEGVETEAQERFLRDHACAEIQGYLFSRPLEADALLSFAADYNLGRLRAMEREHAVLNVKMSA